MSATAEKPIWEMLPDETDNAFATFQAYLGMGPKRTVREAEEATRRTKGGAKRVHGRAAAWAKKFRWTERARAYDDHMARVAIQAKEEGTRLWVSELVEANREILKLVYKRIKEMLALPVTRQTVTRQIEVRGETVDQTITIEGGHYKLSELASILEKTDKIMRLFIGDPTERIAGNIEVGLSVLTGKEFGDVVRDPAQYEALMRIAERVADKQAPSAN